MRAALLVAAVLLGGCNNLPTTIELYGTHNGPPTTLIPPARYTPTHPRGQYTVTVGNEVFRVDAALYVGEGCVRTLSYHWTEASKACGSPIEVKEGWL